MIGMGVEQVQRNGDVVVLTPVWYRNCALNVDEVPLLAVVECKLVLLGSEPLVVVNQSLHLSLGQLRMAVVNLRKNRGDIRSRHFQV